MQLNNCHVPSPACHTAKSTGCIPAAPNGPRSGVDVMLRQGEAIRGVGGATGPCASAANDAAAVGTTEGIGGGTAKGMAR
eukprot:gene11194-64319_t